MNKEYRFNPEAHLHEIFNEGEWKPLTGVTTILKVIAKPALIQWAANMAVDYITDKFKEFNYPVITEDNLLPWLQEARTAHRRKKEEAGQKGTDVHDIIEGIIKDAIEDNLGYVKGENALNDNQQVKHFVDWATQNKVKFLSSELNLYSKELWIGGICDFVCEIDGEVWLGDIKTGSGIYPEHFWQTAAYQKCLEEMGLYKIKGHIILNLKKTGEFNEKRSISNEDNLTAFLSALSIYRIMQKVEGSLL